MRAVTDWPHFPHHSVHPTRNTGNAVSGVITNSHRPLSTTQIAGPRSWTVRYDATSSPMRAVSEVFNEIWNCLKPKAARRINKLVSEIDRYPSSRLQFTTPFNQIVPSTCIHSHLQQLSFPPPRSHLSPLLLIIISFRKFPCYPHVSQLSSTSLCFPDQFFFTPFRFVCLFLPISRLPVSSDADSGFGSRTLTKRPSTSYPFVPSPCRTFSEPS